LEGSHKGSHKIVKSLLLSNQNERGIRKRRERELVLVDIS
jgi:hypothetical protein